MTSRLRGNYSVPIYAYVSYVCDPLSSSDTLAPNGVVEAGTTRPGSCLGYELTITVLTSHVCAMCPPSPPPPPSPRPPSPNPPPPPSPSPPPPPKVSRESASECRGFCNLTT